MDVSERVIDLDGSLRYLDFGGEGPPAVLIHGLGGASINWLAAAPLLARRYRVYAPDLIGFGHTPPEGRSVDLSAQRDLLERFIREVAGGPALVVGNSMGGAIALLLAAEAPEAAAGLVLVNPATRLELSKIPDPGSVWMGLLALPGMGEYLARRALRKGAPKAQVNHFLSIVCHRANELDRELVEAHVELARERREMPWAAASFHRATRSLVQTLPSRRWARAVETARAPTLLVHGREDRLVPISAVRKLAARRPDWQFEVKSAVGHVPQMECPRDFARLVSTWWEGAVADGARAVSRAPRAAR